MYLHCLPVTEDPKITGGRSSFQDEAIVIVIEMLILTSRLADLFTAHLSLHIKNTDIKKKH